MSSNSNFAIDAENVRREFRTLKKKAGFKGTLDLIFNPEYTTHVALHELSVKIPHGQFTGLIGANGAGKTTFLKILSGLIPPSSGTARVLGHTPFDRSIEFRRSISLVMGQKAQLWWDLPASEAFDLLRALYQIPREIYERRVKELTELLEVDRLMQTQIRRLSLGERMKMEVIGAILHLPKLIFLDEPTIGLDVLASDRLRQFLRNLNKTEGTTIILTSHNMGDISELCSRILLLKEGRLIFDGDPKKLSHSDECVLKIHFGETITADQIQSVLQIPLESITPNEEDPFLFSISMVRAKLPEFLTILFSKYRVSDLGIEEPTLERVVQRIYQT